MTTVVMFKEFDPWHPADITGFNKTGYVTESGVVIYPRRSRIARKSIDAVMKQPYRIFQNTRHPRAMEVEIFFTNNVINTAMYTTAMQLLAQPESRFWDHPIKLPILRPITPAEHETRWNTLLNAFQKGDMIFTFDTESIVSRFIAYLDQGTWSHVGTYTGEGRISEAITSGAVERSIEAYHHPRYRLGIYRHSGSVRQIDAVIEAARSQIGKPYAFGKVLRLGGRMILGIWPTPGERRHVTPNMLITMLSTNADLRLVEVI
jgi:Permuted papain-like amidase enzyme, YaeF/YiiX, C92 family